MKLSTSLRRRGWLDAQPPAGDEVVQHLAVARQPEEPVLLRHQLRLGVMLAQRLVDQFGRLIELFAADTVEAFVVLAVQVVGAGVPEPLHAGAVSGIAAGADEVVERQRQWTRQRLEGGRVGVDELLRRHPAASAPSTFFNELSSVPERKRTRSPPRARCRWRASTSACTSSNTEAQMAGAALTKRNGVVVR